MPDERFRLPGSSYGELVKVIRAYGTLSGAASLDEVSKLAAMHPTQISRNNGFLVAIGILEGGKNKVITSKGQDLARALDHEMPDEIRNHWRSRRRISEQDALGGQEQQRYGSVYLTGAYCVLCGST